MTLRSSSGWSAECGIGRSGGIDNRGFVEETMPTSNVFPQMRKHSCETWRGTCFFLFILLLYFLDKAREIAYDLSASNEGESNNNCVLINF